MLQNLAWGKDEGNIAQFYIRCRKSRLQEGAGFSVEGDDNYFYYCLSNFSSPLGAKAEETFSVMLPTFSVDWQRMSAMLAPILKV